MKIVRRLAPPLVGAVATAGAFYTGAPLDIAGLIGTGASQAADRLIPIERSRSSVIDDKANQNRRAAVFEQFGSSVAVAWRSAGIMMTFRPKLTGKVHGLLMLMREQRRFENETAAALAALSGVLLYASTDTQKLAIDLYRALGEQFVEIGKQVQGSSAAKKAVDEGSLKVGDYVVVWRAAAQADLGLSK